MKAIFNLLCTELGFQKEECFEKIKQKLGHSPVDGMCSADYRFLFLEYKQLLLPFVTSEKDNFQWICETINIIHGIFYTKKEIWNKQKKLLQSTLLISSYLFGYSCLERYGVEVFNLYFHSIWIHSIDSIFEYSFFELSCEGKPLIFIQDGERSFAFDKRILK